MQKFVLKLPASSSSSSSSNKRNIFISVALKPDGLHWPELETTKDVSQAKTFSSLSEAKTQRTRWYARRNVETEILKLKYILSPEKGG